MFIFYFSFLLWVGYCLGIGPISFYFWFVGQLVFLPCHCTASTVVSLNLCLLDLFCACHVLFLLLIHVTQYFCWVNFDIILGFLGPFYSFDIPSPLHSFGHHQAISLLHSHGILRNLSGFHILITISFTFGVCWPLHHSYLLISLFGLLQPIFACFLLIVIPMGLLLPFLGSHGPICFL